MSYNTIGAGGKEVLTKLAACIGKRRGGRMWRGGQRMRKYPLLYKFCFCKNCCHSVLVRDFSFLFLRLACGGSVYHFASSTDFSRSSLDNTGCTTMLKRKSVKQVYHELDRKEGRDWGRRGRSWKWRSQILKPDLDTASFCSLSEQK